MQHLNVAYMSAFCLKVDTEREREQSVSSVMPSLIVIGYVCFSQDFFVLLSGKSKPVQRVRITLLHCFCSRFHSGLASRAVSSSLNC